MPNEQLKQFFQLPVKRDLEKGKNTLARLAKRSGWMAEDLNSVIDIMNRVGDIWEQNASILTMYEVQNHAQAAILELQNTALEGEIKKDFKLRYDIDPGDTTEVRSQKIDKAMDKMLNDVLEAKGYQVEIETQN